MPALPCATLSCSALTGYVLPPSAFRGSPAANSPLPSTSSSGGRHRVSRLKGGREVTSSGSRHASPAPHGGPIPGAYCSSSPDRSPRKGGQGADVSLLRVALEQHQVREREIRVPEQFLQGVTTAVVKRGMLSCLGTKAVQGGAARLSTSIAGTS
jgi:hypothetical protein